MMDSHLTTQQYELKPLQSNTVNPRITTKSNAEEKPSKKKSEDRQITQLLQKSKLSEDVPGKEKVFKSNAASTASNSMNIRDFTEEMGKINDPRYKNAQHICRKGRKTDITNEKQVCKTYHSS